MNPEHDFLPPGSEPKLSPDFQAKVFGKIQRDHRRRQITFNAVVFVLACVTTFLFRPHREIIEKPVPQLGRASSAAKGVDWLVQAQNETGSWQTENWGGHPAFSEGVSALATLALLNAPNPVNPDAIKKAVNALQDSLIHQQKMSLDGPQFYNLILTLYTLAEVEKQIPDPVRKRLLEKSYASLLHLQQPDGGWGYLDQQPMGYSQAPAANSAVTWWICHLLDNRPPLQLPGSEGALARGEHWLAERRLPSGEIAYQKNAVQIAGPEDALYWMTALLSPNAETKLMAHQDAYRDYFRLTATEKNSDIQALQQQQRENGAWENHQDRWWRAGGKVYLTAMSVLSQVPKGA